MGKYWRQQKTPFVLTYKGRNAFKIRTRRSGFSFEQHLGWLLSCQWWGCTPEQFEAYDVEKQALMVAAYEAHTTMEALMAEDARKKAEGRSGIGEGHGLNNRRKPQAPAMD